MPSIMCLWKYNNYLEDKKEGTLEKPPCFNSRQSRLHSATQLGKRAYLVTYTNGRCYLVGRITIAKQEYNPPNYKYGQFRIIGDPSESQYYEYGSVDITRVLRQLQFKTRKPIGTSLCPLSQHLQTIRELTENDVALLESCIPGPRH